MKTRIITAVIGLPILIYVLYSGGNLLYSVIFFATLVALYEFFRAFKILNSYIAVATLIATFTYYLTIWNNKLEYVYPIISIYVLVVLIFYVFSYPSTSIKDVAYSIFGFLYVVVLLSHIALVRNNLQNGSWHVWLIFIIAFGSDTMAYFTGVLIGKNKLAERLSPKKTIEGAIGGIVGAIALSTIYGFIMFKKGVYDESDKLIYFAIIGFVGSILSQIGDLSASAMKRESEIKDFGKIMPGHGGLLDRIDSILFTGPFIYYIVTYVIN